MYPSNNKNKSAVTPIDPSPGKQTTITNSVPPKNDKVIKTKNGVHSDAENGGGRSLRTMLPSVKLPKLKSIKNLIPLIKQINVILLVLVTVLACVAHFSSNWTVQSWLNGGREWRSCKRDPDCPDWTIPLEEFAVSMIIIAALLVCTCQIVDSVKGEGKVFKGKAVLAEIIAHATIGGFLLLCGCIFISTAAKIDQYLFPTRNFQSVSPPFFIRSRNPSPSQKYLQRRLMKYNEKIVAGVLAFLTSAASITLSIALFRRWKK